MMKTHTVPSCFGKIADRSWFKTEYRMNDPLRIVATDGAVLVLMLADETAADLEVFPHAKLVESWFPLFQPFGEMDVADLVRWCGAPCWEDHPFYTNEVNAVIRGKVYNRALLAQALEEAAPGTAVIGTLLFPKTSPNGGGPAAMIKAPDRMVCLMAKMVKDQGYPLLAHAEGFRGI